MAENRETFEQLEQEVKRNVRVTTALIVAFIVQAAVFLFIAYQRVEAMTDPKNLADMGEEYLEEHYSELSKLMKQEIRKAAPALAKQVSKQARKSMPEAREEVKTFLVREFDQAVETGTKFSAEQFRDLLQSNRQTIVEAFQEIKELPKETEKVVIDLEKSIEKQLGVDIQKQAKNVLALQRALNKKLERLTSDQSLEPHELLERRIFRIARTIQLRELGKLDSKSVAALQK